MTTLNDEMLRATGGPTVNDGLLSYYSAVSGLPAWATLNDHALAAMLVVSGAPAGSTVNDAWMHSASPGAINDKQLADFTNGNPQPPPPPPSYPNSVATTLAAALTNINELEALLQVPHQSNTATIAGIRHGLNHLIEDTGDLVPLSTATSIAMWRDDFNNLLAALRMAGYLSP